MISLEISNLGVLGLLQPNANIALVQGITADIYWPNYHI